MNTQRFSSRFQQLTGICPFDWQIGLWELLIEQPPAKWPPAVDISTGLGKTHAITVCWCPMESLAEQGALGQFPRRLVYVVNPRGTCQPV